MKRKFNFIPISQVGTEEDASLTVSFSPKYGRITFSAEYVKSRGMTAGTPVRMFVDEKSKSIAWQKVKGEVREERKLKGVAPIGKGLGLFVGKKVVEALKVAGGTIKNLTVSTYNDGKIVGEVDYVVLK